MVGNLLPLSNKKVKFVAFRIQKKLNSVYFDFPIYKLQSPCQRLQSESSDLKPMTKVAFGSAKEAYKTLGSLI